MTFKALLTLCCVVFLSGCVASSTDPSVGKSDFAKLQQWSENVEQLEQQLLQIKPKSEEEAVKLLDNLFDQAVLQAKALDLRYVEVKNLRDKVVEGLGYQRVVMRSMISPKYTSDNAQAFYQKAEGLAAEVETLYEKLEKEFAK